MEAQYVLGMFHALIQRSRDLGFPQHHHQTPFPSVNHLASVANVQVIKTRKSECRFPQGLCFVLVLDNFQFIREKMR